MNNARPWIAVVSVFDWTRIHEFCREHDIAKGNSSWHLFDAPTGGAINCWTIRSMNRTGNGWGNCAEPSTLNNPTASIRVSSSRTSWQARSRRKLCSKAASWRGPRL